MFVNLICTRVVQVGGQRRAGRQMEESPVQTRKGVTRKCDESRADDQRPTEHANGAGTSRRKKAVVVKRVVKKKGGSDTSQYKYSIRLLASALFMLPYLACGRRVSTAVHAATNGLDQRDHIQKDAEARGKMDSKGSLLLSELIDDSDDDFSNMCRGPGGMHVLSCCIEIILWLSGYPLGICCLHDCREGCL